MTNFNKPDKKSNLDGQMPSPDGFGNKSITGL